ncbi:MAG: hypothetical protein QG647_600 [Patescibacteria group bacterium]|nr:hypothetical protein [Patescibacteria group bacterium]
MNPEIERSRLNIDSLPPEVQARIRAIQNSRSTIEGIVPIIHRTTDKTNVFRLDSSVVSVNDSPAYSEGTPLNAEANRVASIARQYAEEQYNNNQFPLPEHLRDRAA